MLDCFKVDTDVDANLSISIFLDAKQHSLITESKGLFAEKILSLRSMVFMACQLHQLTAIRQCSQLGIAIPEHFSNPGISGLKNANPRIESRD